MGFPCHFSVYPQAFRQYLPTSTALIKAIITDASLAKNRAHRVYLRRDVGIERRNAADNVDIAASDWKIPLSGPFFIFFK